MLKKTNCLQRFIFIFCASTFLLSCTDDIEITEPTNVDLKSSDLRFNYSDFDFVGIEHNNALEGVFQLMLQEQNFVIDNLDDLSQVADFTNAEMTKTRYSYLYENSDPSQIPTNINSGIDIFKNNLRIQDFNIPNQRVENYLLQLSGIVQTKKKVESELELLISTIEGDQLLNNNDLAVLFTSISVGKYSHKYWSENMTRWAEIFDPQYNSNNLMGDCSWLEEEGPNSCLGQFLGAMVGADMIAAIGIAVGTAIVNAIPFFGNIAFGGAVVGGAAAASASAGALWLLGHFG